MIHAGQEREFTFKTTAQTAGRVVGRVALIARLRCLEPPAPTEMPMKVKIKMGTILIKEGELLPESLHFESERYSNGWRLFKNLGGYGLGLRIREAGWTFFTSTGEARATTVGFDLEKTTRRTVKKVIAGMKSDRPNCLEITQVIAARFLGLRYVTVTAHQRHIQESLSLIRAKQDAEWDGIRSSGASIKA